MPAFLLGSFLNYGSPFRARARSESIVEARLICTRTLTLLSYLADLAGPPKVIQLGREWLFHLR